MEERINVSEILRNCPKGMELDCTCADNVVFEKIIEYEQIKCVIGESRDPLILDKYGRLIHICCPKCVIFPKGKTSWEGFKPPCKFKDGDVVTSVFQGVIQGTGIFDYEEQSEAWIHVCINRNNEFSTDGFLGYIYNLRFATEEEKAKLFQAIKDNGYKWDEGTKTLEKLIESKEDTDDRVILSGICFDRENYADEVELHLGNYEIEIRDGKTYAVFKSKTKTLRKIEQKPAWSEEDKNFMYDTLSNLTELKDRYGEGYGNVGKCIDWLKSLKYRYTWKPSESDILLLERITNGKSNPQDFQASLGGLIERLKKLKD